MRESTVTYSNQNALEVRRTQGGARLVGPGRGDGAGCVLWPAGLASVSGGGELWRRGQSVSKKAPERDPRSPRAEQRRKRKRRWPPSPAQDPPPLFRVPLPLDSSGGPPLCPPITIPRKVGPSPALRPRQPIPSLACRGADFCLSWGHQPRRAPGQAGPLPHMAPLAGRPSRASAG